MDPKSRTGKKKISHTTPISARLDPEIRQAVENWAEKRKITFSRALETLARSGLQKDEEVSRELADIFGGEHTLAFALLFASVAKQTEQRTRQKWIYDKKTAEQLYFLFSELLLSALPDKLDTRRKKAKGNLLLAAVTDRVSWKLVFDEAYLIKSSLRIRAYLPWRTTLPYDQEKGRSSTLIPELQIADFIAQHLENVKPPKTLHPKLDVFLFDTRQAHRERIVDLERNLFDLQERLKTAGINIDNLDYTQLFDLSVGKTKPEDFSVNSKTDNSFEAGDGADVIDLQMMRKRKRKKA